MNHASLFSGIGGFDLAAEWQGWTNIFSCEKDDKANKVLQKNFPNVIHHRDIFELDATQYEGQIDILTGGFPCQPFSLAGKRKGTKDDRHLWPEMLRIIRECKPTYVVGENVFGLVNMDNGKTLESIYLDLEGEGYKVESFIIPACAVQAWHRRDRIWIIAYRMCSRKRVQIGGCRRQKRGYSKELEREMVQQKRPAQKQTFEPSSQDHARENDPHTKRSDVPRECNERPREGQYRGLGSIKIDTYANGIGSQEQGQSRRSMYQKQNRKEKINRAFDDSIWTTEPNVGRVANGIPGRVDRLKQLGNAIVPQVAYEIFKIINRLEETTVAVA